MSNILQNRSPVACFTAYGIAQRRPAETSPSASLQAPYFTRCFLRAVRQQLPDQVRGLRGRRPDLAEHHARRHARCDRVRWHVTLASVRRVVYGYKRMNWEICGRYCSVQSCWEVTRDVTGARSSDTFRCVCSAVSRDGVPRASASSFAR